MHACARKRGARRLGETQACPCVCSRSLSLDGLCLDFYIDFKFGHLSRDKSEAGTNNHNTDDTIEQALQRVTFLPFLMLEPTFGVGGTRGVQT